MMRLVAGIAMAAAVSLAGSDAVRGQEGPDEPKVQVHERKAPWGTVLEKYQYYERNGERIKHGEWLSFHTDGTPLTRAEYRHGEPHGLVQSFRESRGDVDSEARYVDGDLHGVERHFDLDGAVLFEGTWKNGKEWDGLFFRRGSSSSGDVDRTETTETIRFRNGVKVPGSKETFSVSYRTEKPGDLPDPRRYLRWDWIPYEIDSAYPFLDETPSFEKIPFLIGWCSDKDDAIGTAKSQLVALTRCDFSEQYGGRISKEERPAWLDWWEKVGKRILRGRETDGVRDPAAWKQVAGNRSVPLPEVPVLLPPGSYSLEIQYRGGDYLGVTQEEMTMERNDQGARLIRTYSTSTFGDRITEEWLPFPLEEADRTMRTVAYAIDHPWFLNDEAAINEAFWKEIEEGPKEKEASGFPLNLSQIPGRESMSTYYGGSKFRLLDADGNVWWNDDPMSWRGGNPRRFNWTTQANGETVYPLLAKLFPEGQRFEKERSAGWKQVRVEKADPPGSKGR